MSNPGLEKVVVKIARKSGIPADAVMLDWHWLFDGDADNSDRDLLANAIENFFNGTFAGTGARVNDFLGRSLSIAANSIECAFYTVPVARADLGSPVYMTTRSFSGGVGVDELPTEVACCLSFRSPYGSLTEFAGGGNRPRATKRNRVYIGPLATSAMAHDTTTWEAFPHQNLIDTLNGQAGAYLYTAALAAGWTWETFSPKMWTDDVVQFVSVDNAFDTQRRRGNAPSVRSSIALF